MALRPIDIQVNIGHQPEVAQQQHHEQTRPVNEQQFLGHRQVEESKLKETQIEKTESPQQQSKVEARQRRERGGHHRRRDRKKRRKESGRENRLVTFNGIGSFVDIRL